MLHLCADLGTHAYVPAHLDWKLHSGSVNTAVLRARCCGAGGRDAEAKGAGHGQWTDVEGMLGDLQPKQPWPSTAKLTAYALYDGTMTNDKSGESPAQVV